MKITQKMFYISEEAQTQLERAIAWRDAWKTAKASGVTASTHPELITRIRMLMRANAVRAVYRVREWRSAA